MNRANQLALILQLLRNKHAHGIGRAGVRLVRATAFDRSHGSHDHNRTSGNPSFGEANFQSAEFSERTEF